MSTPGRPPRLQTAARATSSASRIPKFPRRTGLRRSFPVSNRSGWRCISVRRSSSLRRRPPRFPGLPSPWPHCAAKAIAWRAADPEAGVRLEPADIVGPVCESTDTFNRGYRLPRLEEGDLVAFTAAGAYGAVMSSTYNSRPLVPEVLVHGGRFAVIRERPSYEAMLALDTIPDWLGDPAEAPRRRGAA